MKRLSPFLIAIGLLLFFIPIGGRIYMHYQQEQMYEQYLADLAVQNDALTQTFSDDVATTAAITSDAAVEKVPPVRKPIEDVIGTIEIPAISSSQLLLEGSDTKQLRYGAGHVTGTTLPGEVGNCSIAGHRNYTFGSYFSRLDEVKIGDTISITYKNAPFSYVVTETLVVLPDDISVLKNTADSSTVTLITCHPKGSNTERLIVKGVLQ